LFFGGGVVVNYTKSEKKRVSARNREQSLFLTEFLIQQQHLIIMTIRARWKSGGGAEQLSS
jgi:hypothetical protein